MSETVEATVKTTPANVEAEQAVLGSLLIDPDAIVKVSTTLRDVDFYREPHQWIFRALLALHERREPADFVTLVDELERNEQLEEIGGPAYITQLINSTPTAIYADYYARIVERTATLRRLIGAANQIAELAYDESNDVNEVVDRAEAIIFGVSESRIHRDLTPVARVLDEVVDQIDFLARNQNRLMGVPTGFVLLDKMLGGFQKSDLIIVAGRPGMGKSSLGLSIAQNAARRYNARVAVFSLEMSSEQVVQRLLSIETAIDSHRLRMGQIDEEEWPILVEAANTLAGTNIFIDDTPGASVMEIRTKSRRLYAERGIDLIVVDYMQLMSGGGSGMRGENRQQEISFISRSLKGLARELNVPVIALSQLSRAVETRANNKPVLSDLRESGCLCGDTLVYLPEMGMSCPIRDLVQRRDFQIAALGRTRRGLVSASVSNAFRSGTKPVHCITTERGRSIRATANHKFLSEQGWKRLDALRIGECIATTDEAALRTVAGNLEPAAGASNDHNIGSAAQTASVGVADVPGGLLDRQSYPERDAAGLPFPTGAAHGKTAATDVCWDRVISIEAKGVEDVYDLTVPVYRNFAANGFIVNNSIEQDADVVIFVYREDYYDEETERQNIADLMVAKHRHGTTGTVSLYFRKELTQFRDLEVHREDLDY
ncbi:MAG: replicative DNA helicase [Caldilineaceae bacterium SB0675_bin_29]|uniref:Replicative DNA helicase n=1 Tax=Caldilineaceae bacterium SB0675_bin_29 TaxID=2605266 RepID=A0A6B1G6K6_9CHLR|nr:replicative DNA helicase [Caldilineaceae bacterium SB0675_bin_29]